MTKICKEGVIGDEYSGPHPRDREEFAEFTRLTTRRNKIQAAIIEKYGSINSFAFHEKQELKSWTIIRALNGDKKTGVEEFLDEIEQSIEKVPNNAHITDAHRKKIKRIIFFKFETAYKFNKRYPQYSRTFISNVVNGKKILFDEKTREFYDLLCKLDREKPQQDEEELS